MVIPQHLRDWRCTYTLLLLLVVLASCGPRWAYAQENITKIVICDDLDPAKKPCNPPVVPDFKGDSDAYATWYLEEHRIEDKDMRLAIEAAVQMAYGVGWRDRSKLLDKIK